MSLRSRLNLLITLCFGLILVLGTLFVIQQARKAVQEEVSSTANLTLRLIEVALSNTTGNDGSGLQQRVVRQIAGLGETRHLHIEIRKQGIPVLDTLGPMRSRGAAPAPAWFVDLIGPAPMEFRRILSSPDMPETEIIIRADATDEIAEAWSEARVVLGLLVLAVLIANVLVYFTIGRGLAPIDTILRALDGIEQGDYRLRLPQFKLPELRRISEKFNHMAEVLQNSRDENRALTQRSLAIQERERRNLAHELHDELGQSISAIKAVAVSISQQDVTDREQLRNSADTILDISNNMYDVARQMMRRLRPVVLDELGLIVALQEMVDDWNSRHEEMFCHFSNEGMLDNLGEELNISIYRIVQEGLTNISKHSGANEVYINIYRHQIEDDYIELTLKDDGLGFDPKKTRWGLGLLGMRERCEALGGKFSLATEPGQGVFISIYIPLLNSGQAFNEPALEQ